MSVKKNFLVTALCLAVCFTIIQTPPVMAIELDANDPVTIMRRMDYSYDADYDFVISNGKAVMYAIVRGHSAKATKCEVTVELQEKGLLFWDTVKSWTSAQNGRNADVDVSYAVTTGKTYRMVTTVTVWSGSASETRTMTSEALKA